MSKEEARLSALEAVHLASTGALEAAVAAAQAAENTLQVRQAALGRTASNFGSRAQGLSMAHSFQF